MKNQTLSKSAVDENISTENINNKKDKVNMKFGIILSYLSMLISIIGTIFITNRVVNLIGDYNYGLYTFVNSISTWLTVISSALSASFVRFSVLESEENNGDSSKINTIYFKIFLIIGLSILLFGLTCISVLYFNHVSFLQYSWKDSKLMYALFAISIINISINIPSQLFSLYITFKKKFIFSKILSLTISILTFVGHFVIAYLTKDVLLIAAWSIFTTIITCVTSYIFSKKFIGFNLGKANLKENKQLVKGILVFSGIIIFNTIVDQINNSVDKTLLGIFSKPENVTIYQLGQSFYSHLMVMAVSISAVYVPTIHTLVARNDKEAINQLYMKVSFAQSIILSFVAFGFLSCGKEFVLWWVGSDRIGAFMVAALLMLVNIYPLTIGLSIEIQRAMNRHKFRAVIYFLFAILNVILSVLFLYILPSNYAIFACVIGTVITKIFSHWICMNIYNKTQIGLPVGRSFLQTTKYICIGLVSCVLTYIIFYFIKVNFSVVVTCILKGLLYVFWFILLILIVDYKKVLIIIKNRKKKV